MIRPPPTPPLFPYTTLSLSLTAAGGKLPVGFAVLGLPLATERGSFAFPENPKARNWPSFDPFPPTLFPPLPPWSLKSARSEEHTSELQSRLHLVCRLLLEKK